MEDQGPLESKIGALKRSWKKTFNVSTLKIVLIELIFRGGKYENSLS